MNWAPTLFADLILETKDGEWGESYQRSGYQLCEVIRGTDFSDLNSPNRELPLRWIADQFVERKQLMTGDILIETAGGTAKQSTGRTALITLKILQKSKGIPLLCSSFARHLRVDKDKCNPVYLYYLLQTLYRAGYMGVFNLQHTGISRFQFTAFKNKTVLMMPPLAEQQKIAVILIAYDDLIANNQRRITLLESMAEEIYREWFVRMRYPEFRSESIKKGIPPGWQLLPSSELFKIMGGGTPKTEISSYWGGEINFFSPKDVDEHFFVLETEQKITEKGLESCNSQLFPAQTIFITARGTVGKIVLCGQAMAMNQSCYALTPSSDQEPFFHFMSLRAAVSHIKGVSKSGVFDNIVMDTFKIVPILLPTRILRDRFNNLVKPFFEEMLNLQKSIILLRKQRDSLLPRLISGKLKVNHLDIQFPPSMREDAAA